MWIISSNFFLYLLIQAEKQAGIGREREIVKGLVVLFVGYFFITLIS